MAAAQPPPTEPPQQHAFPLPQLLAFPSSTAPELITQGAEGRLYKSTYLLPTIPCAVKHRPAKPWRHPILDARLTRHRILTEARILIKCRREGVPVPAVYAVDISDELSASSVTNVGKTVPSAPLETTPDTTAADAANPTSPIAISKDPSSSSQQPEIAKGGGCLTIEWIEGEPVRKPINEWLRRRRDSERKAGRAGDAPVTGELPEDADLVDLMKRIGSAVGRLHKVGVIHGDLTTSNMMLRPSSSSSSSSSSAAPNSPKKRKLEDGESAADDAAETPASILDGEIVIIDFGLAAQGTADEDRAVDLYVLERAFASTHPRAEGLFGRVLEAYGKEFKQAGVVLKKLEDVRMRGRKRSMIG